MAVPTHDEARAIISPEREDAIFHAFMRAWEDWQTLPDRTKFSRWARTRAGMVFERLAGRLQEAFQDDAGVKFHFDNETLKIVFDNAIVARCKKANANEVGDNIQTRAESEFTDAPSEIPGLGGLKKIEIVYILNKFETAIERVVIHARDGGMRLWVWTLGRGAPSAEIIPFDLPTPRGPTSVPDAADVAKEIVSPRKSDAQETSEETD